MSEKILVVGGGGMLGEPVARRLLEDGFEVRLLARDPSKLRQRFGEPFEIVQGDVEDAESIERALDGCDGVHVNLMGGPAPEDFDRIEHRGTARVARIAARAGTPRLTYLSGAPAREENFHDPGSKAKFQAEEAIRQSGVTHTIFQVTWMMESLSLFVRGNSALVIGKQAHPLRWIAADDYARMVSMAFRKDQTSNQTYFVVGPEALTKPDALETYVRIVRPNVRIRRLPVWFASTMATLSMNAQLRADVRRMAFYDGIGDEFGDPTQANEVFGPARTTLAEWCARERATLDRAA